MLDLSGFSSKLPRYDVAKMVLRDPPLYSLFSLSRVKMYKLPLKTLRLTKVLRSTSI